MSDDAEYEGAPNSGGPVRVLVGIGLLSEIADRLVRIASVLERPDVRLVAADDMHLTLLPPWQETSIPTAVETLRRIAAGGDECGRRRLAQRGHCAHQYAGNAAPRLGGDPGSPARMNGARGNRIMSRLVPALPLALARPTIPR